MRILGLMMVRNGEEHLDAALDSMSVFCDAIFVLNDRSTDATLAILTAHPAVTNVFTANPAVSDAPWYFSEGAMLRFLYQMADFYMPDWVALMDADTTVEPAGEVRRVLFGLDTSVAAVKAPLISAWNDPDYPLMVPLMGKATSLRGNLWRYHPGLTAGSKRLHNTRLPSNIDDFGETITTDSLVFHHSGWDTLEKRISKVDQYSLLDPLYTANLDVPYDRGLLFGYERHAVDKLIHDYRSRYEQHLAMALVDKQSDPPRGVTRHIGPALRAPEGSS